MSATAQTGVEREPSSGAVVRLKDCDAFAHMHNANYIDYFMEAREDQLRRFYGFDVYEHGRESGLGWFVTTNQIQYFEPAAFNSEVNIVTQLFKFDSKRLHIEGRMYGSGNGRLKALCWTNLRAVDMNTGRPRENDEAVMDLCRNIVLPLDPIASFEERIASLQATRTA